MRKRHFFWLWIVLIAGLTSCGGRHEHVDVPHNEDELSGFTMATSNGSYYQSKYEKRNDVRLFIADTEADAVMAVCLGQADIYVNDEVMLTKDEQERLGMKLVFRGEESFDVAFAMQKGNTLLANQLNNFLASAPLEQICSHWINGTPAPELPAAKEYDPNARPLRCICSINLSPACFISEGGGWNGIDPDILRRFARSIGRPIEIKYQNFATAIVALQTGKADILSGFLFITDERRKAVDFSTPYFHSHPGYFMVNKGAVARTGLSDRVHQNLIVEKRWQLILHGLGVTIEITVLSILLGTLLGIGVCACIRSRRKWLRTAAELYERLISGIPILVLLLIMFYVVLADTGLNATAIAIVTFALCFAAEAGSIFDNSISSVPRGQTEAGLSLGFTPLKTFTGIVLPQALTKGVPLFAGACVAILHETSIVGFIAIHDLTEISDLIRSRTFDALIPFLIITVLYFLLAWLIRASLSLGLRRFTTKQVEPAKKK